jgi:hypothetical protein
MISLSEYGKETQKTKGRGAGKISKRASEKSRVLEWTSGRNS